MYSDYRVLGSTEIVDMKDREPEKMTWLIDWGIKKENSELGLLGEGGGGTVVRRGRYISAEGRVGGM